MNKGIEFCGYILTDDEVEACMALLRDIWERKRVKELTQKAKTSISFEISNAISEIGLETTKNIVRGLYRELRELEEADE
jgi:hypothetical protein